MNDQEENETEVEIRKHSDADFFPDTCPKCLKHNLKRITTKIWRGKNLQKI
ncbi:MAG: hypothetical protein ACTSR8_01535 [Promethearchaeota archaeon]